LHYVRQTRLATLYDVLSTVHYPNLSKTTAMKIGGEYVRRCNARDFENFAEEAQLAKPMEKQRVHELAKFCSRKFPLLSPISRPPRPWPNWCKSDAPKCGNGSVRAESVIQK
jgi:hypothetical protein